LSNIVCLGEILVDMLPGKSGSPPLIPEMYYPKLGGAPTNVAINLSRLGTQVSLVCCVGSDYFGDFLRHELATYVVDTSQVMVARDARTTLAFARFSQDNEAEYLFYRNPGADMMLSRDQIDAQRIARADALHIGTFSLSAEPSYSAQLFALQIAAQHGIMTSCDVNMRASVWPDSALARKRIRETLGYCSVIKVNEDEADFLVGARDLEQGTARLWHDSAALVVMTLGARGCFYRSAHSQGFVAGIKTHIVDTVGAGDGFVAGLLHYLGREREASHGGLLADDALRRILRRANAAGAIVASSQGAIPPQLTEAIVESLLPADEG
jgi:sugar/nucleoside kinase (ribokinase family)